jgi:capsule assembly protein Wzi
MKNYKILCLAIIYFISATIISAQLELVPASNPVYSFLNKMQISGFVNEYSNSNLPLSREKVAEFLVELENNKNKITPVDKKILNDYLLEFSFDISGDLSNFFSFTDDFNFKRIFENDKQKYLYFFNDENVSLFVDGTANYHFRKFSGDSYDNSLQLIDAGLRFRGTLFGSVGYYLKLYSGQQISGQRDDRIIAAANDSRLASTPKFISEKYYNSYEGYLRYQTETNWLALTIGREAMEIGTSYIDRMFLSNNAVPYDFIKLDLNYKAISYSFSYGNIRGDSLGRPLQNKNIVNHRLDVRFSDKVKVGFFEGIITSEEAFNFAYLNPISFLTSADFTAQSTNETNSTLGFDIEVLPVDDLGIQATIFIDDIDFGDLGGETVNSNDNKFGYQFGAFWVNSFFIPNLDIKFEYTRLDPFVYSHRTNKSTYSHYGFSLGHVLPPNSDEIAINLFYPITHRINVNLLYQYQRSGEGFEFDEDGNLTANYGGSLLRGEGDFLIVSKFLSGDRVNRNLFTFDIFIEPINQYYIKFTYKKNMINRITDGVKLSNDIFYLTVGVDF